MLVGAYDRRSGGGGWGDEFGLVVRVGSPFYLSISLSLSACLCLWFCPLSPSPLLTPHPTLSHSLYQNIHIYFPCRIRRVVSTVDALLIRPVAQ